MFYENVTTEGKMWDVALGCVSGLTKGWLAWRYEGGEERVDWYINAWREGRWSFEEDGEKWNSELLEQVRRGRERFLEDVGPE
jgi:hypothetical protein